VKKLLALIAAALVLGLAWRFTPLAALADPEALVGHARGLRDQPLAVVLAPLAFVALSLVLCPLVVLRLTTVLLFGPLLGPLLAIAGVALCALIGHAIGARLGADGLERLAPRRVAQLRALADRRGLLAIAAMRLLPLGPFMVVNAAAGAARLRRRDFVAGTVLGLMPGLVAVVLFAASAGA
jgi:uncharacterized membrane protein YdjX (TVP38/TMEM64 family)